MGTPTEKWLKWANGYETSCCSEPHFNLSTVAHSTLVVADLDVYADRAMAEVGLLLGDPLPLGDVLWFVDDRVIDVVVVT